MKNTTLLLGVSLAVVAGLFGSGIFGVSIIKAEKTGVDTTGTIQGHVITTLTDSDGNIKAYRQSDNLIVNQGENCALKLLFASGIAAAQSDGQVCTGAITHPFTYIEIGNGSSTPISAPISTDVRLYGSHNNTDNVGNNPGMTRKVATSLSWTNSTTATSTDAAALQMSATFTNSGTSTKTVNESGLFNDTAANYNTDGMFARQTFTAITMNAGDSLTVQWTINIGGTSSIS